MRLSGASANIRHVLYPLTRRRHLGPFFVGFFFFARVYRRSWTPFIVVLSWTSAHIPLRLCVCVCVFIFFGKISFLSTCALGCVFIGSFSRSKRPADHVADQRRLHPLSPLSSHLRRSEQRARWACLASAVDPRGWRRKFLNADRRGSAELVRFWKVWECACTMCGSFGHGTTSPAMPRKIGASARRGAVEPKFPAPPFVPSFTFLLMPARFLGPGTDVTIADVAVTEGGASSPSCGVPSLSSCVLE